MNIEVSSVTVTDSKISISGIDLDAFLFCDDIYAEQDPKAVVFDFDRKSETGAPMKYLWKVVSNNKKCATGKSFGAKLDLLVGQIIFLPDSFAA